MSEYRAITEIIEYLAGADGRWVRAGELADGAGVTDPEEFKAVVTELAYARVIRAEGDPLRNRLTDRERELAATINFEPAHLFCLA